MGTALDIVGSLVACHKYIFSVEFNSPDSTIMYFSPGVTTTVFNSWVILVVKSKLSKQ